MEALYLPHGLYLKAVLSYFKYIKKSSLSTFGVWKPYTNPMGSISERSYCTSITRKRATSKYLVFVGIRKYLYLFLMGSVLVLLYRTLDTMDTRICKAWIAWEKNVLFYYYCYNSGKKVQRFCTLYYTHELYLQAVLFTPVQPR